MPVIHCEEIAVGLPLLLPLLDAWSRRAELCLNVSTAVSRHSKKVGRIKGSMVCCRSTKRLVNCEVQQQLSCRVQAVVRQCRHKLQAVRTCNELNAQAVGKARLMAIGLAIMIS